MPTINFEVIEDSKDFSLIPIGRYPARLEVDAYQKDSQGKPMTGPDNKPAPRRTQAGDEMWNLVWHLLNKENNGRTIFDNLNFTPGGQKRVKVIYVRGGFATGHESAINIEPDDLQGTYWWIEVEHPDPADALRQGQPLRESKYVFKAGKCACDTCTKYNGQKVSVFAKVPFAGMEPMAAGEVKEFIRLNATANDVVGSHANGKVETVAGSVCKACGRNDHSHQLHQDDCPCENEVHPDF